VTAPQAAVPITRTSRRSSKTASPPRNSSNFYVPPLKAAPTSAPTSCPGHHSTPSHTAPVYPPAKRSFAKHANNVPPPATPPKQLRQIRHVRGSAPADFSSCRLPGLRPTAPRALTAEKPVRARPPHAGFARLARASPDWPARRPTGFWRRLGPRPRFPAPRTQKTAKPTRRKIIGCCCPPSLKLRPIRQLRAAAEMASSAAGHDRSGANFEREWPVNTEPSKMAPRK